MKGNAAASTCPNGNQRSTFSQYQQRIDLPAENAPFVKQYVCYNMRTSTDMKTNVKSLEIGSVAEFKAGYIISQQATDASV
jgi:hypothetical protein